MEGTIKLDQRGSSTAVTCDTVRYYERLRLLPRANRTRSGYRLASLADAFSVAFVASTALRLSFDGMRESLPPRGAGLAKCQRVRDLLSTSRREFDTRLAEMRAFLRTLTACLSECEPIACAQMRGMLSGVVPDLTCRPSRSTVRRFSSPPEVFEGEKR